MTIATTANKIVYAGNGATTTFPFTFPAVAAADLQVYYTDTNGNISLLNPGSYTVVLNAAIAPNPTPAGGTVTYPLSGSPIALGTSLTIVRTLPEIQNTSLSNQGTMYPAVVEEAFDYLTMLVQQLQELLGRQIAVAVSDPAPALLPPAAQRANQAAIFDSAGNMVAGQIPANGVISSAMQAFCDAVSIAAARAILGVPVAAVYLTKTTAAATQIDATTPFLITSGYTTSGDGGDAIYYRIAAPGAPKAWQFQTADGQWWQLANRVVRPEHFGARGGGIDDVTPLQNFFLYLSQGLGVKGFMSQMYTCSGTITIADGANPNGGMVIEGGGYDTTGITFTGAGDGIVGAATGTNRNYGWYLSNFAIISTNTGNRGLDPQNALNCTFEKLHLRGWKNDTIRLTGTIGYGAQNTVIRECKASPATLGMAAGNPAAVNVVLSNYCEIEDCYFTGAAWTWIIKNLGDTTACHNNVFEAAQNGIQTSGGDFSSISDAFVAIVGFNYSITANSDSTIAWPRNCTYAQIDSSGMTQLKFLHIIGLEGSGQMVSSFLAPLKVIRGRIDTTGPTIKSGEGFTLAKTGTGQVTVTFTTDFADVPAVTVAVDRDVGATGRIAYSNNAPTVHQFDIQRATIADAPVDGTVSFVAVGRWV